MTVTAYQLPALLPNGLFDSDSKSTSVVSQNEVLTESKQIRRIHTLTPDGPLNVLIEGNPPTWFSGLIREIIELSWLPEDWYSYGANKVDISIIRSVIQVLPYILDDQSQKPLVGPTSTGGIVLEWHFNGKDLELEFESETDINLLFVENDEFEEVNCTVTDSVEKIKRMLRNIYTS